MVERVIIYPALDISFDTWSKENETYIDNNYFCKPEYFKKFYKNHEFADRFGYVFLAKTFIKRSFWNRINPFACSYELVLENTGKKLTIQEVKNSFIEHKKYNKFLSNFDNLILSAKTFRDILG